MNKSLMEQKLTLIRLREAHYFLTYVPNRLLNDLITYDSQQSPELLATIVKSLKRLRLIKLSTQS